MVQYISPAVNHRHVKKTPFASSAPEWAELANKTHKIEPPWIKKLGMTAAELHQNFEQYNHSGQHDTEMGDWCSQKELERWVRPTKYKTAGSNTIICLHTAMVYSICLPVQCDFEGLGRQIPKGTGVDGSMTDGTKARKRKGKRNKYKKKNKVDHSNNSLLLALNDGTKSESKIAALHLLLEFKSASLKTKTVKEVKGVANSANEAEKSGEEEGQSSESQSIDSYGND
jgi:hypothetical protein